MKRLLSRFGLFVSFVLANSLTNAWGGEAAAPSGTVILDTASLWRMRTVWETPEVVLPSGQIEHGRVVFKRDVIDYFGKNFAVTHLPDDMFSVEKAATVLRLPADTPETWMRPGFDDGDWARLRGPVLKDSKDEGWKLILLRGTFNVPDVSKAGALTLSLEFHGGAVVYLNGSELTRVNMPKDDKSLYAPGESYANDVYFDAAGYAVGARYSASKETLARLANRERKLTEFKIPQDKLAPGANLLAIAIHRSPTLTTWLASHSKDSRELHIDCLWAKSGLSDVRLTAEPGSSVVPGKGATAGRGFKVWNQSVVQRATLSDYPDSFSQLNPIKLVGARGGTFAGSLVLGDEKAITGLKVEASELKGPGTLPAAAVMIRYAKPDVITGNMKLFDSLEEVAPAEVPVYKEQGGSMQPLWITVKVPPDAQSGDYAGKVTIHADGIASVIVPLQLRVVAWTLPVPDKTVVHMDLIQSPESVAMAYDVPMWADAHLKLLDKTFGLMAELSAKTLFLTCIRRTHLGNEHAVVRWTMNDDGELTPDFSMAEKYLDVARKHLGPIPCVVLYAWEPAESQGHAHAGGDADKAILITVVDKETGKLSAQKGPAWGSPESRVFWKKLSDGMQEVLKKRGMENSLLFGLVGDSRPTKQAMDEISNGVPGAKWAVQSHLFCDNWYGYPMRIGSALWGIGVTPTEPELGYAYGWSNPMWLNYFPRETKTYSPLVEHRAKVETYLGATASYTPSGTTGYGACGLGRIGVDFWPVNKDDRGRVSSLPGRYPESAWGQLSLQNTTQYILGRGTNGPIPTIRSEAYREGLQEVEARIYIEKALLDDGAKALLGDELRSRARTMLDDRIRVCLRATESFYISSGWMKRSETLFQIAGEIAAKYNGREPNPTMKPRKP